MEGVIELNKFIAKLFENNGPC